ncbi:MAG: hypothetical protein P9L88_08405 [Candidatus Tantalella remota]|nr:hypothetical protein [Candidatus Tantalella remota]
MYLFYIRLTSSLNRPASEGRVHWIWAAAILSYAAIIPPILSIDLYEYIMRGRMLELYGLNPFFYPPAAVSSDPMYPLIFWKNTCTTYGPLWSLISAWNIKLFGDNPTANILSIKALMLIVHLLSAYVVYLLAEKIWPAAKQYITALYLFNPYIIFMNLVENHNDIFMLFFMLLSLYLLKKNRFLLAITAITLSTCIKYISILIAPFLFIYAFSSLPNMKTKLSFTIKSALISIALFSLAFAPFRIYLWDIVGILQSIKLRLDTNTTTYLMYSLLQKAGLKISTTSFQGLCDISFILVTLSLYIHFMIKNPRSMISLLNHSVGVFLAYLFIDSFQFGSWYMLWVTPLIILSGIKKKYVLFMLFTLAALISFWKRISFLLIGSSFIYAIFLFAPAKGILANFLPDD